MSKKKDEQEQAHASKALDLRDRIREDKDFVGRQPDSTIYDTNAKAVSAWLNSTRGSTRKRG